MKIPFRIRALRQCLAASSLAAGLLVSHVASAAPLAIGTVEQIDNRTSSIVVLGQRYSVGSATLSAGSKTFPAMQGLRRLAPGAIVWVDGELDVSGRTKVNSLTVLPELNVPGSTQVFVAGRVTSVDRVGRAKVGDLLIDVTPLIGVSGTTSIRAGDLVEIVGVQPTAKGLLVASASAPAREVRGVGGTGVQGVGGTGVQGVGGTGVQGVGGTGVQGVGGTGVQGVGGTGIQGVGGTGVQGVGGTGIQGVGGTGVQGVGGTGVQGVGGTGVQGVGGTGIQGVGGTGVQGVGGTGVQGVGGTGARLQGVGGTGLN